MNHNVQSYYNLLRDSTGNKNFPSNFPRTAARQRKRGVIVGNVNRRTEFAFSLNRNTTECIVQILSLRTACHGHYILQARERKAV